METFKREVREIPAHIRADFTELTSKEKVAYYARVSTEFDEQEDSFERQKEHFETFIKSRSDWEFVGGYADYGLSGTQSDHRPEFLRMIQDCKAGKINRILVKSISRFARNTMDTLQYIKELKEMGISVYFETQGVDTMTPNGDVMITILAALAEQESRTISSNIKWSYKKRFQDGKVLINFKTVLGYTKENKMYVVVEDEAKIVRRIFDEYLEGKPVKYIADELNSEGITTKRGNKWTPSSIQGILNNEKYTGNAYLGKTFKTDVLSKKRIKNVGQETMYYVKDSHPAIITQEVYDMAQVEKARRSSIRSSVNTGKGRYSSKYPLSGLMICSECGSRFRRYGRKLANGEFVSTWVCIQHQKDNSSCGMLPLKEEDVLEAYQRVLKRYSGEISNVTDVTRESSNEILEEEKYEDLEPVQTMLSETRKAVMELFKKRRNGMISADEYNKEYEELSKKIKELEIKEQEIYEANTDRQFKIENLKRIQKYLSDDKIDLLEPYVMRELINYIRVLDKHNIEFQFNCDFTATETI